MSSNYCNLGADLLLSAVYDLSIWESVTDLTFMWYQAESSRGICNLREAGTQRENANNFVVSTFDFRTTFRYCSYFWSTFGGGSIIAQFYTTLMNFPLSGVWVVSYSSPASLFVTSLQCSLSAQMGVCWQRAHEVLWSGVLHSYETWSVWWALV